MHARIFIEGNRIISLRDTCCKKLYKMLQVPYFSGYLEHFSYESAAGAGRTLNRADNHFSFLCWYRRKAPEWLAIPLNYFLKHSLWSYPYTSFAVHRLIYYHIFEGFWMLCYVKDTIDVAFEVSVVLFHGFKVYYRVQWLSDTSLGHDKMNIWITFHVAIIWHTSPRITNTWNTEWI